jgi:hypothetical protein
LSTEEDAKGAHCGHEEIVPGREKEGRQEEASDHSKSDK